MYNFIKLRTRSGCGNNAYVQFQRLANYFPTFHKFYTISYIANVGCRYFRRLKLAENDQTNKTKE